MIERQFPAVQERTNESGEKYIVHFWDEDDGPWCRYRERNISQIVVNDKIMDLSSLPAEERTAFILSRMMGMTQKTIANAIGVRTVTVGQYVSAAEKKLGIRS